MSDFLSKYPIEKGPFEPTWESLRQYQAPDWFRDGKLGIWAHWGPQCVPMYGDWYARHMYWEGHPQYLHHWRNFGHPSKFGYKDLVKLWKAEKFDPEGLMDLYKAAGATYFFAQAVHHDNFDNWNSKHNKWNSTKIGPMRDICALWKAAAKKRGLKFGISEHLGASFSWFLPNKGADKAGPYAGVPYDGNDPAFVDFYYDNRNAAKLDPTNHWKIDPWYTTDVRWHEHWLQRVLDMIDQLEPDLLYSDGALPFVWQTDTCVGGWYYDVRQVYKTPNHVIEMFVDIVAKNGCLLLNFTQKPDGTLDDENLYILKVMAGWIKVNGEGIYGTRPWKIAMEGPTRTVSNLFKEDALSWTTADFRFTSKGDAVYAFQMHYPEHREAFIRNLGLASGVKVKEASVLGYDGKIVWRQLEDGLLVQLPANKVVDLVPCIKVKTGA
jgi:alpha-L-fucosidase